MGKNGALMRAAKKQKTTYTFTREQLEARDRTVEQAYQERFDERLRAAFKAEEERVNAEIAKEWKRRERIFGGDDEMFKLLSMTISIPAMVLVDEFDWKPLPAGNRKMHPRAKLARFVTICQDIFNEIAEDRNRDIMDYCREAWDKTGVRLDYGEEEQINA